MELKMKCRMVIAGIIHRDFDRTPTKEQMIEEVEKIFPNFQVENEPVTWTLENVFYMED